jgi:hypothetical protein
LFDIGPEDAGFRVDNRLDENGVPELQRKEVDQFRTSDVMYQAKLFAVVHGTIKPDGTPGTVAKPGVLIVMDFNFVSNPEGRRFKGVEITVAFGREDSAIGDTKEPEVLQLAPEGTFAMDESIETQEDTVEGHVSAQGGSSLASLGIGGSFQRKVTKSNADYSLLHGMGWIEGRNEGAWNSAKWIIREHRKQKSGVPPKLRTAILLSVPEGGRFRAELTTEADIGFWSGKVKRKVGARTGLQPVYFDTTDGKQLDMGPKLEDVVKTDLGGCKLGSIGRAEVSQSTGAVRIPALTNSHA